MFCVYLLISHAIVDSLIYFDVAFGIDSGKSGCMVEVFVVDWLGSCRTVNSLPRELGRFVTIQLPAPLALKTSQNARAISAIDNPRNRARSRSCGVCAISAFKIGNSRSQRVREKTDSRKKRVNRSLHPPATAP